MEGVFSKIFSMFEFCCPASKPIETSFVSFSLLQKMPVFTQWWKIQWQILSGCVQPGGAFYKTAHKSILTSRQPVMNFRKGSVCKPSCNANKRYLSDKLQSLPAGTDSGGPHGSTNIFIIKNFDNQQMMGRVCCWVATAKSFSGKLVAFPGISAPKQAPIQLVMTYCLARCLFWARALPQKLELLSPFWATEASRGHPAQLESFSTDELSMAHLQEKSTKASWIHIEARLCRIP